MNRPISQRRFESVNESRPDNVMALGRDHPAIVNNTTCYPATVVDAADSPRLLVSGKNNRKIGREVTKGPWAGMPIYTLTLVERETCPTHCAMWASCYGNAMHLARRHRAGKDLEDKLIEETWQLGEQHAQGFVVRLHVLGDFYSVAYARLWQSLLGYRKGLRLYGYTAHAPKAPEPSSEIAAVIREMNAEYADRCFIRFSARKPQPMGATVIDYRPDTPIVPEGIVCPAETQDAECCVTCGLCWSPATRGKSIVFIRHGKQREQEMRKAVPVEEPKTRPAGEWEEFLPRSVAQGARGPKLIANRVKLERGRTSIRFYVNARLLEDLRWTAGSRVRLHFGRGENAGRLLVRQSSQGGLALRRLATGAAYLVVSGYSDPWPDTPGKFLLAYHEVDGNLVIELPDAKARAA